MPKIGPTNTNTNDTAMPKSSSSVPQLTSTQAPGATKHSGSVNYSVSTLPEDPIARKGLSISPSLLEASRSFKLDDTPISPKASYFSPRFIAQPEQPDKDQAVVSKPLSTVIEPPPPLSRGASEVKSQPPNIQAQPVETEEPQKPFLTIQDLQDDYPFSSFSGSGTSPTRGSNPSQFEMDRLQTDLRRPSYASQFTTSSYGSRRQGSQDDSSHHSTSPTTRTAAFGPLADTEEPTTGTPPTSIVTRFNSRVNPIVFPEHVGPSTSFTFLYANSF